jgi:acylphosphatase
MTSSPNEVSTLRALVRGRVQGVGFRFFVIEQAAALGLSGYARNLSNGETVEVVAEGPMASLEALLAQLRHGPPLARVERVDVSWAAATGEYKGFGVR